MSMRILITGANGQLGKSLLNSKKSEKFAIIALSKNEMNLSNPTSIKNNIRFYRPDWIINAGAYTEVDKAEIETDLALAINYYGTKVIAEELNSFGGKLLQISTDFVFSGNQGIPYETDSPRNPLGIYGKSKVKAEEIVEKLLFPTFKGKILRTSWLMGPVGRNFALTMLNLHNQKNEIQVVSDQVGCPTSTESLANACWQLIDKENINKSIPNILHWSDAGAASWYDVAIAIGEIGKQIGLIDNPAKVLPIKTSEYPTAAQRPSYSLLNCLDSAKILDLERKHWRASLTQLLINHSKLKVQ